MGVKDWMARKPLPIVPMRAPTVDTPLTVGDNNLGVFGRNAVFSGRQSMDDQWGLFGTPSPVLLPPPTAEDDWRTFTLDSSSFHMVPPDRILELLADLSPEVSRAVWDYLRMCNPGWDFAVYRKGSTTEHKEGKKIVQETLDRWGDHGSTLDTIFSRMNLSAFLRGAIFTEVIFDESGREALALVTPDPVTARFRKIDGGIMGKVWELGQMQGGTFNSLAKYPSIQYVPVDPFPSSPYGRPLAAPAIFTGLFLLGLLHDLRRVVAQQGYPRIDISIDTEVLMRMAPSDVRTSSEKLQIWIDGIVAQVQSVYSVLEPTDAYIHIDAIKLNKNAGVIDTESLGSLSGIISALERMSIRALKTMPLLMAVMEGASDNNSNRQWEIQVSGIKAIQHIDEHIMQRNLKLALQAKGIQADVKFRFAELRSSEGLRDAQTEVLTIQNAVNKYAQGWTSHEEGAIAITGHSPDNSEPRVPLATTTNEPPGNATDTVSKPDGNPSEPATTKSILPFQRRMRDHVKL